MVARQDKKDGSRARACARSTAITAAALAMAASLGAPAFAQPGSGGMMGQYQTQPVQTAPEAARGYPPGA